MSEPNGQGKSRLDRIEEIIERQERANEAAHLRFEAEDQRLLTAQILMNAAMQKMADGLVRIESNIGRFDENMVILELKMQETTEKLNALIDTVDGIIRKSPPQPG